MPEQGGQVAAAVGAHHNKQVFLIVQEAKQFIGCLAFQYAVADGGIMRLQEFDQFLFSISGAGDSSLTCKMVSMQSLRPGKR